jgi:hypothetical protein
MGWGEEVFVAGCIPVVLTVILILWAIMAIVAACPILLGLFFGVLLYLGWRLLWAILKSWLS